MASVQVQVIPGGQQGQGQHRIVMGFVQTRRKLYRRGHEEPLVSREAQNGVLLGMLDILWGALLTFVLRA